MCPHEQRFRNCRLCSPGLFCGHGKRKRLCIQCAGWGLCQHGLERQHCSVCQPWRCVATRTLRAIHGQMHNLFTDPDVCCLPSETDYVWTPTESYLGATSFDATMYLKNMMGDDMTPGDLSYVHMKPPDCVPKKHTLQEGRVVLDCRNLQPLTRAANSSKGAKLTKDDRVKWVNSMKSKGWDFAWQATPEQKAEFKAVDVVLDVSFQDSDCDTVSAT